MDNNSEKTLKNDVLSEETTNSNPDDNNESVEDKIDVEPEQDSLSFENKDIDIINKENNTEINNFNLNHNQHINNDVSTEINHNIESSEFKVTINDFDGPFDLLLALVKEKKMDIMNLDLVVIAKQYVAFVSRNITHLKIDDMTEYLLMASYLLELKSKKVLPVIDTPEKLEKEIERDKFIQRLLIYKQFKNLVPTLMDKMEKRYEMHEKESNNFTEYLNSEDNQTVFLPDNLDVQNILKAMQKVYLKLQAKKPLVDIKTIDISEVSIDDVEQEIKEFLSSYEAGFKISLTDYLNKIPLEKFTKQYFVVTFVALLVLVRHQHIMLEQDINNDEEIYIIKRSVIENEEVLGDER
ncbi:segregation and condensation protein A [Malacoplasma iowae]|uniref:Segregation and condensation protein A n=1 Tax=Malacoplasma iowae DK-CPA TaxID=1394179 RepID=A0A084U2V9_MALIO|nr:segregation/condensation protein A [Malacoplasma iowae]KFB07295.1 segregation and condensation protein A [Malacoplasma iowae DK-CPA]WPL37330.1 segregation/condensation protein A [Malacoplasma iowae]WPL37547.1 segregation/condensation protein A [Malacoplasma iowae]WPL39499.1 segregation/condensation protein A [Malacoplasma iowae]WPL40902.1 segregation/condensation protein A [Malacoplasma iowae]